MLAFYDIFLKHQLHHANIMIIMGMHTILWLMHTNWKEANMSLWVKNLYRSGKCQSPKYYFCGWFSKRALHVLEYHAEVLN